MQKFEKLKWSLSLLLIQSLQVVTLQLNQITFQFIHDCLVFAHDLGDAFLQLYFLLCKPSFAIDNVDVHCPHPELIFRLRLVPIVCIAVRM